MRIERKFTFDDLNSFVDGRFSSLHEWQERFYNQTMGVNECLESAWSAGKKAEIIHYRLLKLKAQQGGLDFTLDLIEKWQNIWDENLNSFEKQYPETLHDDSRSAMYDIADKLFTTFETYHSSVQDLESKLGSLSQNQDTMSLLCAVITRNHALLEKLYLQIEKLQSLVDISDRFFRNFRSHPIYHRFY